MSEIILYSNKVSRGRVVQWMLEELEIPYRVEWLNFGPDMKNADYLAINPMGKVPALQYGESIVTETGAILIYLAETFPQKGLLPPAGTTARATFYRWMFFIAGPLEAATTAEFMGWKTPEFTSKGTSGKGYLGYGSLSLTLDTLERQLINNLYLCGDAFSAADIYLASHLTMDMFYTKVYSPRPAFSEYLKRIQKRPAKQRVDAMLKP